MEKVMVTNLDTLVDALLLAQKENGNLPVYLLDLGGPAVRYVPLEIDFVEVDDGKVILQAFGDELLPRHYKAAYAKSEEVGILNE